MPEGHTIHRLADLTTRSFAGDIVAVCSPQGRFAAAAARLDGLVLRGADAHGKHLFLDFGADEWVHIHLGLSGRLSVAPHPVSAPVGQVRMRLVGSRAWADLRAPAICELIPDARRETIIRRLGPDPLRADADERRAWRRIRASRTPIAALLMDQSVIAGVGNIYRAEVLFRHGVDPMLAGTELPEPVWQELWSDLGALMRTGVRDGRIDTVRAEHTPAATGRLPRRDRHGGEVYVYRRAGQQCHVCRTPVERGSLAGRTLFWCPTCQPPGAAG